MTSTQTTEQQTAVYLSIKDVAWNLLREYHVAYAEYNPEDAMGAYYGISAYCEPTPIDPTPYVERLQAIAERYSIDLTAWLDWMVTRYTARKNWHMDEEADLVFSLAQAFGL